MQDCPAGLETEEDDTMAEDANTTVETTQTESTPAATEQTAPAPQTYTAEEAVSYTHLCATTLPTPNRS